MWNGVYSMKMKTSSGDISNKELMHELKKLNTRFDGLEGRFDGLEVKFDGLEAKVDANHVEAIEAISSMGEHIDREIGKVRAVVVTKDYLDDKLADLRSDLVQHTRKEIDKIR